MLNSTKITILAGAVVLSFAALAGCGDDSGGTDATSSTTSTTSTTSGTGGSGGGGEGGAGGGPACKTDVCATYGAAVPAVAGAITDAAAADPQFQADFAPLVARGPEAVQAFKTSLANFIVTAYGCDPNAYTGPTMEEVHAGMGITQGEYDAFIVLIAGVLKDSGVPDDDINNCFAPPLVDPAFSSTIVGQ